jgi:hypothetical protein
MLPAMIGIDFSRDNSNEKTFGLVALKALQSEIGSSPTWLPIKDESGHWEERIAARYSRR